MADDDKWDTTPGRTGRRTISQIMDKSKNKKADDDSDSGSSSSDSSSSSSSSEYEEEKLKVVTTGLIDTYEKALDFAWLTWNKLQRENGRSLQCTVWGSCKWKVGEWVKVYLPSFHIDGYMYITQISQANDGGDWTCQKTLVDFPPGWGVEEKEEDEDEDADKDDDSDDVDNTVNKVISEISKFSYSHSCSDAKCIKSKKKGDCHALSDYIYTRLKKAGIPVRIYQYATGSSNNHRQVKYKDGSKWVMFPYSKAHIDHTFYTNSIPEKADIYKK